MCGIAGILNLTNLEYESAPDVGKLVAMLHHRGPEAAAIYQNRQVTLAHARLSIIDLAGGVQPLPNEDGTIWATVNGEFFDYQRTQQELKQQGHQLRTQSDSEILLHLYENHGVAAIQRLRGQFAFGLWDQQKQQLWLGRDRFGIRPIYYTIHNGYLIFASEIKALLAAGVPAQLDREVLAQTFTTWSPLAGSSLFSGIHELPAGHYLLAQAGTNKLKIERYHEFDFTLADHKQGDFTDRVAITQDLLSSAIEQRLVADVPVGAYLSGGLDSSLIVALAQQQRTQPLHTFSVAFDDADYDESNFQQVVAHALGTQHHVVHCGREQIAAALPDVVWHSETALMRLSPVPLFLLSQLVQQQGLKVVLTGEGADEFFGGYTIFREMMIRRFMARDPHSDLRPLLLKRLYAFLPALQKMPPALLKQFFGRGLDKVDAAHFSHLLRWQNNQRGLRFFSAETQQALTNYNVIEQITARFPAMLDQWQPLAKAQYIEIITFLSTYLLSSQGDRMAMAHAVEGRYPFLDQRLVAWANGLPIRDKVHGLRGEKYILKQIAQGLLPQAIIDRPKQPYRSPIRTVFTGQRLPDYAEVLLSAEKITQNGYFDAAKVTRLTKRIQTSPLVSEGDQMAFVGILTTQLWQHLFVDQAIQPRQKPRVIVDVAEYYAEKVAPL